MTPRGIHTQGTMTDKDRCDNLDQRLLEQADPTALMETIATCLGEEIRRFAQSRCGRSRGDLDDISQDVLLAAQRYLSTFRGEASLRTWLGHLVVSACSRHRRGRKNDPALHRPLDDAEPTPDSSNPEAALMITERLSALQEAIGELREEDRQLLAEVEWQGGSLEDVGQRHGLTVPAMKSRMFRIRRQLKERVQQRFALDTDPSTPEP